MSNPRLEILKMVAEGKLSPEDGDRLINALNEKSEKRDGASKVNIGRAFDDAAQAVRSAATEGVRAVHKVFEEHRPGTEPVMPHAGLFDLPSDSKLRIQPAFRVSIGGTSAGGSIRITGVDGERARIVQGSAVEIHRYRNDFVLTWAKSNLELEVPRRLAGIAVRGLGGDVHLDGYEGPFRLEGLGGNFTIDGPKSPFRIRSVGGAVKIRDLAVTDGTSTISATGGDVEIDAAASASVEIRATTSLGGSLVLPDGGVVTRGRTRSRGDVRLGDGEGDLRIDTVAGWVRIHSEGVARPAEKPTPVREAAGDAMGDSDMGDSEYDIDDDDVIITPPPDDPNAR